MKKVDVGLFFSGCGRRIAAPPFHNAILALNQNVIYTAII